MKHTLVFWAALLLSNVMAMNAAGMEPRHFFYEEKNGQGEIVIRALSVFEGGVGEEYQYRLTSDLLTGRLVRALSSGLAVFAQPEGNYSSVWIGQIQASNVSLIRMDGVEARDPKAIDVREGDNGTFHLAWLTPDSRTIRYAHVDPFADKCCISVASYRDQAGFSLPPSFYLSSHVLVGRNRVAVAETKKREGNPETQLSIFQVDGRSGGLEGSTVDQSLSVSPKKSGVSLTLAELASGFGFGGLKRLAGEIKIGSHLQPEAEHSWYGESYIALGHHLNEDMTQLELKLTAVIDDNKQKTTGKKYQRTYFSDVSILSNLAEPLNAYESGLGRGGLAWLESSPGHKVTVVVYRDGNLDTTVPLNSEVAGAVSIKQTAGDTLYWMDQGEDFLPVVLLRTGDGMVFQVDLEEPDDFTILPADDDVESLKVWSAQTSVDDDHVAFVLPIYADGRTTEVYLLSRRWEGAYLKYFWEPLRQI